MIGLKSSLVSVTQKKDDKCLIPLICRKLPALEIKCTVNVGCFCSLLIKTWVILTLHQDTSSSDVF